MKSYDTTKPYKAKIKDLIKRTWQTTFCSLNENGVIGLISNYATIDHVDGIGTKGYYHWNGRTFRNAVLDALAMNLNDLSMFGAIPLKLLDHVFLPEDDHDAFLEIVESLVHECCQRDIAIVGGESAVHMNMNGMDISIAMTGIVDNSIHPNRYEIGDVLVGLPSSGLHSNGFTFVHQRLSGFRQEFVIPTKIYNIYPVYKYVHGLNHITGGGFTKILDFISPNASLYFENMECQDIFHELFQTGLSSQEMYETFNCGYGFVLGVPKDNLEQVLDTTAGRVIGEVIPARKSGVVIRSTFDGSLVSY